MMIPVSRNAGMRDIKRIRHVSKEYRRIDEGDPEIPQLDGETPAGRIEKS